MDSSNPLIIQMALAKLNVCQNQTKVMDLAKGQVGDIGEKRGERAASQPSLPSPSCGLRDEDAYF